MSALKTALHGHCLHTLPVLESTLNPLLHKVIGYPNHVFQIPSCHCLAMPSAFQLSHDI